MLLPATGEFLQAGGLDLAFDDLEPSIDLDPQLATAWLNWGNAYLQRDEEGDTSLALADFMKVIELAPDEAMGYNNRGCSIRPWRTGNSQPPTCRRRRSGSRATRHSIRGCVAK